MVADKLVCRTYQATECADCMQMIHGRYYSGIRIVGKVKKYCYPSYWWLCEACALARGWIW